MSRDSAYLLDILQAAKLIREYVQGLDEGSFRGDTKTQDAVIRRIAIIGDATKQLSESFRVAHPEIPWKAMAGMRDVVIHDYNNIRLSKLWSVAQEDIPALIAQVEPLVPPDTPDETAEH